MGDSSVQIGEEKRKGFPLELYSLENYGKCSSVQFGEEIGKKVESVLYRLEKRDDRTVQFGEIGTAIIKNGVPIRRE